MMNGLKRLPILLLAAALGAAMILPGCTILGKAGDAAAGKSPTAGVKSPAQSGGSAIPDGTAAPSSRGDGADWDEFAAAFTAVDKNPLNEAIAYSLWLAQQNPQDETTTTGGASGEMKKLAEKYAAIVAAQGIHYVEVSDALGFQIKTEVWVKGQKFMKRISDLNEVILYDGTNYIKYDTEEKTGTRFSGGYAAAEGTTLTKGMLTGMAGAPAEQKADETFGAFDCSVFYFDIEILGMKGETLYVDKATGMLVKMQMGDPEDKKTSMATFVESLEVGGFGDEAFTVPGDITLTDY